MVLAYMYEWCGAVQTGQQLHYDNTFGSWPNGWQHVLHMILIDHEHQSLPGQAA